VTSVIGYQLEGKRPQLTGLGFAGILIGWGFWSIVILGIAARRDPMQYFLPGELGLENLIWPALAVIAFIAIAWRKVGPVGGTLGAEKLRRYGAMWHGVYAAAWFAALGLWPACLLMTVFTIVGIASMTLLKELTSTDPGMVGYRV
jgi:hypothetical protein